MAPYPPADDREALVARLLTVRRAIASPAYPMSNDEMRRLAVQSLDRSYCPDGAARQMAASSTVAIVAPRRGWRTTWACTMPGIVMSCARRTSFCIRLARVRVTHLDCTCRVQRQHHSITTARWVAGIELLQQAGEQVTVTMAHDRHGDLVRQEGQSGKTQATGMALTAHQPQVLRQGLHTAGSPGHSRSVVARSRPVSDQAALEQHLRAYAS